MNHAPQEAYAYYAAHQVQAQADAIDYAKEAARGYLGGEYDAAQARELLGKGEEAFDRAVRMGDGSIQIHGREDFVPPLSVEAKAWAAENLLEGKVYPTFWDVPAVKAEIKRSGLEP